MTKNLNPFLLDRKLNDPKKHEMISMIWRECMPAQFYKFICREENFIYMNRKNVLQTKVSEILTNFLAENEKNYVLLRNNLSQYKNIFQDLCLNVFREIHCTTGRTGFDLKSTFHIVFKTYKDKNIEQLGKNSQNYKNAHAETSVSEQKPMKIDDFNEAEKKEVKERIEKGKMKRREVAEKNELLKKRKKNKRKIRKMRKKCGVN